MAITTREADDSRDWEESDNGPVYVERFWVYGTPSQRTAAGQFVGIGSTKFVGPTRMVLRRKNANKQKTSTDSHLVTLRWELLTWPSEGGGDSELVYDLTADTAHVTEALSQRNYNADGGFATGSNVVGDNGAGEIEGVDVLDPKMGIEASKVIPAAEMSLEYLVTVYGLEGHTNNAVFGGFAPGVLLFLGGRFRRAGEADYDAQFRFVAGPNRAAKSYENWDGDEIEVGAKTAWEYEWFRMLQTDVNTGEGLRVFSALESVHIAEVYPPGDFGLLNVDITL